MFLPPLEMELPVNPPLPMEISAFEPPSPSEFPVTFLVGGGGVWIFSGTTHCFIMWLPMRAHSHFKATSSSCHYFSESQMWSDVMTVLDLRTVPPNTHIFLQRL